MALVGTSTTGRDGPPPVTPAPEPPTVGGRRADLLFRGLTAGSTALVFVLIAAIGVFLALRSGTALRSAGWHFFTREPWFPDDTPARFGVLALAFGSIVSSAIALLLAVPVAIGSALFLTELAPGRLGQWLGYVTDLLAAVPSVVFGLWGVIFLVPRLVPVERRLDDVVGWLPPLHSRTGTYGRSLFAASVVLAVMVLPIVAAISREIFRQVPRTNKDAALALGATRWEMIRLAVLPFSAGGLVGAVMLGLGRALGETIAVALVLSATYSINPHVFEPGGNTIAANIAVKFGEAGATGRSALIASGLVLFAITLLVNAAARAVVARNAAVRPA